MFVWSTCLSVRTNKNKGIFFIFISKVARATAKDLFVKPVQCFEREIIFCGKIALNLAKLNSFEYAPRGVSYIEHMGRRGTNALGFKIELGKRIDYEAVRIWDNLGVYAQISPMRALPLQTTLLTHSVETPTETTGLRFL